MPKIEIGGPYWKSRNEQVELYLGDVLEQLRSMPSGVVQTAVTSPPYWGLRAYATGDAKHLEIGAEPSPDCGTQGKAQCGRCFVCSMVGVFREVKRVLRDDGTLWLNLGDSYSGGGPGRNDADPVGVDGFTGSAGKYGSDGIAQKRNTNELGASTQSGGRVNNDRSVISRGNSNLPSGNLMGVPWCVALALQADGWILRQDIIWHKPAPMPESVRNRCTKAHEYVFLLTKRRDYFCDMEAIKEEHTSSGRRSATPNETLAARTAAGSAYAQSTTENNGFGRDIEYHGRNKRSVWTVSTQGYPGAHFATFPPKLIEPMIRAGTSERGACAKCGAPWRRVLSKASGGSIGQGAWTGPLTEEERAERGNFKTVSSDGYVPGKTTGWEPTCECHGHFEKHEVWVERPVSLEKNVGDHEKKAQTQGDLTRSTQRAPKSAVFHGGPKGSGGNRNDDGRGTALDPYFKQDGSPRALPLGTIGRGQGPPGIAPQSGGRGGAAIRDRSLPQNRNGITGSLDGVERPMEMVKQMQTVYVPSIPLEDHPTVPCLVLDPFMGSGTTALVALDLGLRVWGIDLSREYMDQHAIKRIKVWLANKGGVVLPPPRSDGSFTGREG